MSNNTTNKPNNINKALIGGGIAVAALGMSTLAIGSLGAHAQDTTSSTMSSTSQNGQAPQDHQKPFSTDYANAPDFIKSKMTEAEYNTQKASFEARETQRTAEQTAITNNDLEAFKTAVKSQLTDTAIQQRFDDMKQRLSDSNANNDQRKNDGNGPFSTDYASAPSDIKSKMTEAQYNAAKANWQAHEQLETQLDTAVKNNDFATFKQLILANNTDEKIAARFEEMKNMPQPPQGDGRMGGHGGPRGDRPNHNSTSSTNSSSSNSN